MAATLPRLSVVTAHLNIR